MAQHDFITRLNNLQKAMNRLPNKVAIEAVRFSKERFEQQNWIGDNTEPWKRRKPVSESATRSRRGILTDSGRLRRSIRKVRADSDTVVVGTDVPYAEIHNTGGTYNVSQSVKAHERKAFQRNGRPVRAHMVSAHRRSMTIHMPRRQFIGNSPYLSKRLIRMINAEFNRYLK